MEENKFIANFALQFDETDPELIQLDTNFKELDEWSSLTALSIMAMLDEEYGVKLTPGELKDAVTLVDIFQVIQSKA